MLEASPNTLAIFLPLRSANGPMIDHPAKTLPPGEFAHISISSLGSTSLSFVTNASAVKL